MVAATGRAPFVGREVELAALRDRLAAAGRGEGGVFLVAGDAGIGKTRLVAELAERARADGWTVLTGRAYQAEGLPPYLPFVEPLRAHVRATTSMLLREQLGEGAADVALLVRELHADAGDAAAGNQQDPPAAAQADRYRLFESVTDFLLAIARGSETRVAPDGARAASPSRRAESEIAAPAGLLLVLDDLHWADAPTLQLLLHLARRLPGQRLLIVGTYRDGEVARGGPLAAALAELVRDQVSEEIALGGLSEADVGRYIETASGVDPPTALVGDVHRETQGNPLFVAELVRLLAAEGRLNGDARGRRLTVPRNVQHVIGQRLDRLSDACNAALTLAAVIGREFALLPLELAGDLRGEPLLEALEEAEEARLIAALPGAPGRFSFSHPLIRETLYAQILTSRRVRLHRRVADALERLHAADPETHLAELAHHFFQAAPGGDVAKAVALARRAGDRAMVLLAYEEAARLYASALQALTLQAPDEPLRCALLLALGEAQVRAGETAAAKETFRRTAALARSLGLVELQARAALGYGGYRGQPGIVDGDYVELAEEALAALGMERGYRGQSPRPEGVGEPHGFPNSNESLRARLLARLAMELYFGLEFERCDALSAEAVSVARRAGDDAALAAALVGRHYAIHAPDNLAERLTIAAELIRLAEAAGDREVALQGHYLRAIDALEAGDIDAVDAAITAHDLLAAASRQPLYRWRTDLLLATRATLEGRLGEGVALARRAVAIAGEAGIANGPAVYGVQMLTAGFLTGAGLEALEAGWRAFADRFPGVVAYRAGLMLLLLYLGREAEAREQLERIAAGGTGVPRDDNYFSAMACLAETCAALDDIERAAALYAELLPYGERAVVINAATGCRGVVAEYLGLLATTLGRWAAAEGHFAEALARNGRLRAEPYALRTRLHHAAMLIRRNADGDAARAGALLDAVLPAARALGMAVVATRAERLLEELRAPAGAVRAVRRPTLPDGLSAREVDVLRLLAEGRTNKEIAARLVLSARTVDHHIAKIYRKIKARRRADAAAYAQRIGLVVAVPAHQ